MATKTATATANEAQPIEPSLEGDSVAPWRRKVEQMPDNTEIVGREGLATTIATVAQQVSSLEKSMAGNFEALKTTMSLNFENIRLDLKRVEVAEQTRQEYHDKVHVLEARALDKAQEVNEGKLAAQNEWRQESQQRQETYPTRNEVAGEISKLEVMISRNAQDLLAAINGPNGINVRLRANEDFINSVRAQLSTIRALLVLIPIILGVIAFIAARWGV